MIAQPPIESRPNILLIVTDQERHRDWLPSDLRLPQRDRLRGAGTEFARYYTNAVPCSPARACLVTGQYLTQHGVHANIGAPQHATLSTDANTLGRILASVGYRTPYFGKWHLSFTPTPDLSAYGYSDWSGNDWRFMGLSGTGLEFDDFIASQAVDWLDSLTTEEQPWFLTVALVNPHDVMWFPIDQPDYQRREPDETAQAKGVLRASAPITHGWRDDDPIPPFTGDLPHVFDELPASFDDDLFTKPAVQRQWMAQMNGSYFGSVARDDVRGWCRMLDYYWWLHQRSDEQVGRVLDAAMVAETRRGKRGSTIVVFTSDHGEMCGSHGLRSKGPFMYEDNVRVPLYIVAPGVTEPGSVTNALASHVDLAATIVSLARAAHADTASDVRGVDLTPVLRDPNGSGRESVLLAHDQAEYPTVTDTRYAYRALVGERFKYARYYGVGGGVTNLGDAAQSAKRYDVDAAFEDHDHELYDLREDPHELVNLANDRSRRQELRDWFDRLLGEERVHMGTGT